MERVYVYYLLYHRRGNASWMVSHPCRRSEEHTSELQSQSNLVCRLLLEKKKMRNTTAGSQSRNVLQCVPVRGCAAFIFLSLAIAILLPARLRAPMPSLTLAYAVTQLQP